MFYAHFNYAPPDTALVNT